MPHARSPPREGLPNCVAATCACCTTSRAPCTLITAHMRLALTTAHVRLREPHASPAASHCPMAPARGAAAASALTVPRRAAPGRGPHERRGGRWHDDRLGAGARHDPLRLAGARRAQPHEQALTHVAACALAGRPGAAPCTAHAGSRRPSTASRPSGLPAQARKHERCGGAQEGRRRVSLAAT